MINLLSPQEKNNLEEEERLKLALILGILFLSFLITLCLILFSIKIVISGQLNVQKMILSEEEKKFNNSPLSSLQEFITNSNKIISKLNSFYNKEVDLTDTLAKIYQTLPPKTYLKSLDIKSQVDKDGKGFLNCALSGFSPSREVLIKFRDNLEGQDNFKEVSFRPQDSTSPTNIDFLVNLKIYINN